DPNSAVRRVFDEFWTKEDEVRQPGGILTGRRDFVKTPRLFEEAFHEALRFEEGDAFWQADLVLCTEPFNVCAVAHEAGKPVLGYIVAHLAFLLKDATDHLHIYSRFTDSLSKDPRNTFATVAPYVSMQMFHHLPTEVPAISQAGTVLLNKRPQYFWQGAMIAAVAEAIFRKNHNNHNNNNNNNNDNSNNNNINLPQPLSFATECRQCSFQQLADFRAAVFFPYDWLQTMAFYDFINMAVPTFVPDTPFYTYSRGTNGRGEGTEWLVSTWSAPRAADPFHYNDWDDTTGRMYWWMMTDFRVLPGVSLFSSAAELVSGLLSEASLLSSSATLREARQVRVDLARGFYQDALLRALFAPPVAAGHPVPPPRGS
ncbi:unnamed protein product, partial [Polarella glacialis]